MEQNEESLFLAIAPLPEQALIFLKQDVGLMGDVGKSTELASLLTGLAVEPGNVGLGFHQFSLELVVFLHQSLHVL
ncbi:hypothetical protein ACIOV9_03190 [Pseudomonas iridis]|uniref:hypothetical protein n=1 Tax=Pseudomonas iridis TaxID=2710587 RepID=UPI0037FDB653